MLSVVGDVLVLHNQYVPEQLWLPFVNAVFPSDEPHREVTTAERQSCLDDGHKHIYLPELGVDQLVLPFRETQFPTRKMQALLLKADYPAFERSDDGSLYITVRSPIITKVDAKIWVSAHCTGRVVFGHGIGTKYLAIFEKRDDYILAIVSGKFISPKLPQMPPR